MFTFSDHSPLTRWRYWSETAKPGQEQVFPALSCNNYYDFEDGKCNRNQINFMGYGASPRLDDCLIVIYLLKFNDLIWFNRVPGKFYNKIKSNQKYVVSDDYFMYLVNSLQYRSDLTRIAKSVVNIFKTLTRQKNKKYWNWWWRTLRLIIVMYKGQ